MRNNKIRILGYDESKLKRIKTFALTTVLLVTLSHVASGETICDPGVVQYQQRVFDYQQDRRYDENIKKLYESGQINIDGVLYKTKDFFITINTQNNEKHLMSVKDKSNDILTGGLETFDYDRMIRFRDTTAFVELLNSDCVFIDYEKNIITIIDKESAIEIINKWDGLIHDKVPETDAVENKSFLRK